MVFYRGVFPFSQLRSRAAQQSNFINSVRWFQKQTSSDLDLHSQLKELIPEQQERIKKIKQDYGEVELGKITIDMVLGGMRGMTGLLWETSFLDPHEGIRFRGLSIPECQKVLPGAKPGGEPLPEGLLWLLLTGKVPRTEQVISLSKELRDRANVPDNVYKAIDTLPINANPMTQFAMGVMALEGQSEFQKAYEKGIPKSKYWEPTYEDSLNLIARLPLVASYVYRRMCKGGKFIPAHESLDYAANFAHMLGFDSPQMHELMRLYVSLHSDHEGGNVSAHTGHLVGSALSNPYLSFTAALNGLAGPLHGLASQEVLIWLKSVAEECGENITTEQLKEYVWKTLKSGKVVPGFGHSVLLNPDPRYTCQREFALKHLPDDPLFQLVSKLYEVVPPILTELGKVKNPWPNVDAHSGVLLNHYGLTEARYYAVLFGVSRSLGICSQLIWDRALRLPLERPKSITMEWLGFFGKRYTLALPTELERPFPYDSSVFVPYLTQKQDKNLDGIDFKRLHYKSKWIKPYGWFVEGESRRMFVPSKHHVIRAFDSASGTTLFYCPEFGHYIRMFDRFKDLPNTELKAWTDASCRSGYCTAAFYCTNGLNRWYVLGGIGYYSSYYGEVKALWFFWQLVTKHLHGVRDLIVMTDCEEAWQWVWGITAVPSSHADCEELVTKTQELMYEFMKSHKVIFKIINRDRNLVADKLSKLAHHLSNTAGKLHLYDSPSQEVSAIEHKEMGLWYRMVDVLDS